MNRQNIARWIRALESGDYEQGVGHLHWRQPIEGYEDEHEDMFCCLGVGCVVAGIESRQTGDHAVAYGQEEQVGLAPREFMEWIGLPNRYESGVGGDILVADSYGEPRPLSALNDSGATFATIAALLRSEFNILD